MALYTNDSKERVREAVDMVDLVSSRTELRRAGVNRLTGLCPFHDERTPSFGINPVEKVYHCFGCQASGDVFTFVMETEGVDFKGALELLADRYKVTLELEDEDPRAAEKRQARDRLLELLERTAAYYVRQLWESTEAERARKYLAERGLEEGTLREFRVGYAPSAWDTVLKATMRAGFKATELWDAGLLQSNEKSGRKYDRFRSQIIFALADARGRVLGFAGRSLVPDDQRRGPKYVNSPESDLFHKRSQLFAADLARAAAAKAGSVVAAEGYTDVIAMHQAGVRNSVAIMGTSLTEEQVGQLARLAPVVALALDSDSAGQEAMLRAAGVAAKRKLELRVVELPPGEDPADLVQRAGGAEIERLVAASVPFARFRVLRALDAGDLRDAGVRDRVLRELHGVFATISPGLMRDELIRIASGRLGMSPELTSDLIGRAVRAFATAEWGEPGRPEVQARPLGRRERTERTFLAFCIARPDCGATELAGLDVEQDFTDATTRRAALHLREHLTEPMRGLDEGDSDLAALMRELTVRAARLAVAPPVAFEIERLQLSLARLDRDIAGARRAGSEVADLAARRATTQARIDEALDRAMRDEAR